MKNKNIIALSAPSGCGKTTILQHLDGTLIAGRKVRVMTSLTTRALRESTEAYRHRITEAEFNDLLPQMVQCISFASNQYGILRSDLDNALADENIVFVDVVPEGATQLERHYPGQVQAVFLYLHPKILLQRLQQRKSSPEEIQYRMELSVHQLHDALIHDRYVFIENTDLESTLATIKDLLQGHPIETIVPDLDRYRTELKEAMSNAQF